MVSALGTIFQGHLARRLPTEVPGWIISGGERPLCLIGAAGSGQLFLEGLLNDLLECRSHGPPKQPT